MLNNFRKRRAVVLDLFKPSRHILSTCAPKLDIKGALRARRLARNRDNCYTDIRLASGDLPRHGRRLCGGVPRCTAFPPVRVLARPPATRSSWPYGEYRLHYLHLNATRARELNRSSPQLTVTRRHGPQQLWLHDVLGLSVGLRWVADDAGPCVARSRHAWRPADRPPPQHTCRSPRDHTPQPQPCAGRRRFGGRRLTVSTAVC